MSPEILVKWGPERLHFALPPPDAKLSDLRQTIADYTHLPKDSFKLIHLGAVMKDNSVLVSAYGIKNRSAILVVGSGETLKPKPQVKAEPQRPTEQSTISTIRFELNNIHENLVPSLETFLGNVSAPTPPSRSQLAQEHARLGELLLQTLLRLDAIFPEGQWEEARKERKVAVKEVQGLLDRLDDGWNTMKD